MAEYKIGILIGKDRHSAAVDEVRVSDNVGTLRLPEDLCQAKVRQNFGSKRIRKDVTASDGWQLISIADQHETCSFRDRL